MSGAAPTPELEAVFSKLQSVRPAGSGFEACCPAHDDRTASLSLAVGTDGRVLLKCHAGCTTEAVLAAVGLELRDLFPPPEGPRISACYDYCDEAGKLIFQAVRLDPKAFRQRRPDSTAPGGWKWNLGGVRRVLFLLRELLAADPGDPVFVCEGEKDALSLARLGLVATCNPMGAGKWRPEYSEALKGRAVVILADNDGPGRDHAAQVARSLTGVADSVGIVELPGLPEHGDVTDWIGCGGTAEELLRLAGEAPDWTPAPAGVTAPGEPPIPRRIIPYVDLETMARDGIPPVPWIWPELLAEGDIALVGGPAGCGKTTTIHSAGVSLARKRPWCGMVPPRAYRVLIVDEEQGRNASARTLIRLGAPDRNVKLLSMAGVRLSTSEGCGLLVAALEDFRPEILVLDSLTQIFSVANENDASEVGQRFAFLFELRDRFSLTIIGIHHKPKDVPGTQRPGIDRFRGSTVFTTQASTCWSLTRVSRDSLDLEVHKRREGDMMPKIRITYATDGPGGRITLTGQMQDDDSATDQAADAALMFLRASGSATFTEILDAVPSDGATKAGHKKAVSRALKDMVALGHVTRPKRGVYECANEGLFDE